MDSTKVEKIAIKARKEFEENKIDTDLLADLYRKYNPHVRNINSFVSKSKDLFPKLNCGLTSVYLKKIFGRGKVIYGKYRNHRHSFLLLNKDIIVDITADQYGGPKVYVGQPINPWVI